MKEIFRYCLYSRRLKLSIRLRACRVTVRHPPRSIPLFISERHAISQFHLIHPRLSSVCMQSFFSAAAEMYANEIGIKIYKKTEFEDISVKAKSESIKREYRWLHTHRALALCKNKKRKKKKSIIYSLISLMTVSSFAQSVPIMLKLWIIWSSPTAASERVSCCAHLLRHEAKTHRGTSLSM